MADLASPSFSTRETATRALMRSGCAAFEPMLEASVSSDREVAARAVRVLERLASREGEAFARLLWLSEEEGPYGGLASRVLEAPEVRAAMDFAMPRMVGRLVSEARDELASGHITATREKALAAATLNRMFHVADPEAVLLFREIELADRGSAVKSVRLVGASQPDVWTGETQESVGTKMFAATLLRDARTALSKGRLDEARAIVLAAQGVDGKCDLLEARLEHVLGDIRRVNDEIEQVHDGNATRKGTIVPLLTKARALIKEGRIDEARNCALVAATFDVTYGLFEDRPQLILADIRRIQTVSVAGASQRGLEPELRSDEK